MDTVKKYLKNIDYEAALELSSMVAWQEGQIVSRTLVQNKALSITLFAFDAGEEISSHESTGDAVIYVMEGTAAVTIGANLHFPTQGEVIVMPAGIPHAVEAKERFKMMLIVVFPSTTD